MNPLNKSHNNKPLRDFISAGRYKPKGATPEERLQNFYIWAQARYPYCAVPLRYAYKAITGARLPHKKSDEVTVIQKDIKRLKKKNWSHQGMTLVYSYGDQDNAGYRLCVDEDDKIASVLDAKMRQVDTRINSIHTITAGIDPSQVREEANLEKLDRAQVMTNQLLLPEAEKKLLLANVKRARHRLLLKGKVTRRTTPKKNVA